jgi:hypothetical protein
MIRSALALPFLLLLAQGCTQPPSSVANEVSPPQPPPTVECSIKETTKCAPGKKCPPGVFRSEGATQEECGRKVTALCKELCESAKPKPGAPKPTCKCGPVVF